MTLLTPILATVLFLHAYGYEHACEDPWLEHERKCYLLVATNLTWNEAFNRCHKSGADLVMANDESLLNYLSYEMQAQGVPNQWIGLHQTSPDAPFTWVDGTSLEVTTTFWDDEEPQGVSGPSEMCVLIKSSSGKWATSPCTSYQPSICAKAEMEQNPPKNPNTNNHPIVSSAVIIVASLVMLIVLVIVAHYIPSNEIRHKRLDKGSSDEDSKVQKVNTEKTDDSKQTNVAKDQQDVKETNLSVKESDSKEKNDQVGVDNAAFVSNGNK